MKQIQDHLLESSELNKSKHLQLMRQVQTTMTSEMFALCGNDGNVADAQDIDAAKALLPLLSLFFSANIRCPELSMLSPSTTHLEFPEPPKYFKYSVMLSFMSRKRISSATYECVKCWKDQIFKTILKGYILCVSSENNIPK